VGARNSTRGRKYFLLGRGNISSPGDSVMGETLFRDIGGCITTRHSMSTTMQLESWKNGVGDKM